MTDRRFLISCLHCKRIVTIASRIADRELDQLRAHLSVCSPNEVANPPLGIEAILRHFRVAAMEP